MPVVVVASMTVKPDSVTSAEEIVTRTAAEVHTESGCELYAVHRNDNTFVFIEQWADPEALQAHGSAPAVTGMFSALSAHLDGAPQITTLQPVPAGDPEKGRLRG
ncbi:antibiotic biosynthesis monooxygenase [Mycolicibacillus parakoreensis]|uniref:Antibiotic biosynthesis monooxygenase n=1 Tax=Mycolicibacillus parakoreensis TaxID=1069221 RepID=A0ABY3U230_9MYCO|nr:putative quinol monooxygenase [Mycolicibacillus parakoreensis]MCV7317351.1 antibiotic biosynthesis monooxygenase [Mycolicibacillus parakoreensis]ULN51612.1 antibiotic biosynthesis monooxygenase [Mycolicibacillus parakoreensis]HLR99488.1 putative quinol monooxygenase [Mycolicibacillus parakoreensis]